MQQQTIWLYCGKENFMRKIRKGLFETNSSSVHAVCIDTDPQDMKATKPVLSIWPRNFGWDFNELHAPHDTADYVYTYICVSCYDESRKDGGEEYQRYLKKFTDVLNEAGVGYSISEPQKLEKWADYGIDHYGLLPPLDELLKKEVLLPLLFGEESVIFTGNDNDYAYKAMEMIVEEFKYKNPQHVVYIKRN